MAFWSSWLSVASFSIDSGIASTSSGFKDCFLLATSPPPILASQKFVKLFLGARIGEDIETSTENEENVVSGYDDSPQLDAPLGM